MLTFCEQVQAVKHTKLVCHSLLLKDFTHIAGVVSELGSCCAVNTTAGATVTLDRAGSCCSQGLDACGVCGGDGVVVDFTGNCCNGALDASGLCCAQPHVVDEFGVCAGNSSTGVIVLDLSVLSSAVSGKEYCYVRRKLWSCLQPMPGTSSNSFGDAAQERYACHG